MKINFSALFLNMLLQACASEEKMCTINPMDKPTDHSTTIINIKNENGEKEFHYSNIFSKIEFVNLESTPESTIGEIKKLEITNRNDFIVFDFNNKSIVRFDESGKYLNHIGNKGHGPCEYVNPFDVTYDPFNDQIIIYDFAQSSLLFYDYEGNLISKTKFDFYFDSVGVLNSEQIVLFVNHMETLQSTETEYDFKIVNRRGDIIAQFDPYSKDRINFRPYSGETLKYQNGQLQIHKFFTPLVFSLSEDSVVPLYYIDLGDMKIAKECYYGQTSNMQLHRIVDSDGSKMYVEAFFDSENWLIVELQKERIRYFYACRKNDDKNFFFGKTMVNDVNGFAVSYKILKSDNNKIYLSIDPNSIQHQVYWADKKQRQVSEKDRNYALQLAEHTNPIIQICTLR